MHLQMQGKIQIIRQLTKILSDVDILYSTNPPPNKQLQIPHKLSPLVFVLTGQNSQTQLTSADLSTSLNQLIADR